MCGIAGIVGPGIGGGGSHNALTRLTEALAHRGPDGAGYHREALCGLGHRRLSIVDLEGGKQPIANEDGTIHLVCNGEVYNSPELRRELEARGHRFRTRSDVEVILHLYEEVGTDVAARLRGMFAFALWDRTRRRLVMARDHMGQKPLFYAGMPGGGLAFASEPKAFLAAGLVAPEPDLDGLWHHVSMRYLPDAHSMFRGIAKLPAATLLVWEAGRVSTARYWNPVFAVKAQEDEATLTEGLDALLRETVSRHLQSDVPVGAFLSGGIDSGLVSALMATVGPSPVPTFSVGVEDQGFDELPYARQVARRYGFAAHERVVKPDLIGLVPTMVHHLDEPADPFAFGVWAVSDLASKHVKVALTGDGGDESFAGYDRFAGQRLVDMYCMLPGWLRRQVFGRLVDRLPDSFGYKSFAQKVRWLHALSGFSAGERYVQSLSYLRFTEEAKRRLFTDAAMARLTEPGSDQGALRHFEADTVGELVDRMLYTDLMTRMPDHLLSTVDRMSMAHSLETRAPLVDPCVVEYAAALPVNLKLRGRQLKYVLRQVARRYLPAELVDRPKQGFSFPIARWLKGDLAPLLLNLFSEARFVELGLFRQGEIDRMIAEHVSGRADHNYRLWLLVNLEIWYRHHIEGRGVGQLEEDVRRWMGRAAAPVSAVA